MARTHFQKTVLAVLSFQNLLYAQTLSSCDQVPGGPGNGKDTYKASIACKCSGAGGCDSVQFAGYSSYKYAELVISDQSGRRFEQQPTLTWQRAGVRPTQNDSQQIIATTGFSGQANWAGFGTGLSDSAALNLNSLTPAAKNLVLSEYFDSQTGNDYNLVRTNIGTSTYSTHPYTYDEVEGDFDMEYFNLTAEDYDLKMPILNDISKMIDDLQLIAALWTGPNWLKDVGLENYGKIIKSDKRYQQALVQYLAKYVDAYQAAGFDFWGISPLNQPTDAVGGDSSGFPNTAWQGFYFGEFLFRFLAPYFQTNYPGIELISNENNKDATILWMTFLGSFELKLNQTGLLDIDLFDNVNYFGVHSVSGDHITPGIISRVPEITTINFHPISTENEYAINGAKYTAGDFLGSWNQAEAYARNMINDININSTLWLDWNMILNQRGGPSWAGRYAVPTIMADPDDNDVFYKNPSFYAIGHFSKLIKKGWHSRRAKVPYSGPHHTNLDVAVMESPDVSERVAVILSRYDYDIEVNYYDKDLRKEVPFTVPARSICTLYYALN